MFKIFDQYNRQSSSKYYATIGLPVDTIYHVQVALPNDRIFKLLVGSQSLSYRTKQRQYKLPEVSVHVLFPEKLLRPPLMSRKLQY